MLRATVFGVYSQWAIIIIIIIILCVGQKEICVCSWEILQINVFKETAAQNSTFSVLSVKMFIYLAQGEGQGMVEMKENSKLRAILIAMIDDPRKCIIKIDINHD